MKPLQLASFIVFSVFLFWIILTWGDYIISLCAKQEPFTDTNTPLTSHNVDMPLTTSFSCQNMCGSKNTCFITGEQCTSDVDCQGCQPLKAREESQRWKRQPRPENDAGILTFNNGPRYSSLTTDIGTQNASLWQKDKLAPVPVPDLGYDLWTPSANVSQSLYDDKMTFWYSAAPKEFASMPIYPKRQSVTGIFVDNGPLAANAFL